jgi:hypothetical protein
MTHRKYYTFDPDEVICPCADEGCTRTIKGCDTFYIHGGKRYCSMICGLTN